MKKKGTYFLLLFIILLSSIGGANVKLNFDKAFYKPGSEMTLFIEGLEKPIEYELQISHGVTPIFYLNGTTSGIIKLEVPKETGGYGIDIKLSNELTISRGFSVQNHWTDSPRYGFLTDFFPERFDIEKTMNYLVQYHINCLQYYDWMYDYGKLVYDEGDEYKDAWQRVRKISNTTLKDLINEGHKRNIASMAYVAIYACNRELGEQHPEWLIYNRSNNSNLIPVDFYKKILLTNTLKDSGWTKFLINECKKTIEFGFDGIHLDQYGYPKDLTSYILKDGKYIPYRTSQGFLEFINLLKEETNRPVIFNYVNNWPNIIQDKAKVDAVYIEPWESCNTYEDLYMMITGAKEKSGGKPVILAAYLEAIKKHSIFLADSVIAVSGGRRLEIGEIMRILSGPYFPGADVIDMKTLDILKDYYDFQVRYEDFLNGSFEDLSDINFEENYSIFPKKGNIWVSIKNSKYGLMINFINLKNLRSSFWRDKQRAPEEYYDLTINFPKNLIPENSNFYFISPDGYIKPQEVKKEVNNEKVKLSLPYLKYWSAILVVPQK
ncbi:MAG: dextranase [Thermosipho sp. (in: thermotogales)]|nr:dextranase [Geotoga sp.]MDN5324727.1 dextranase [Thermosipho sp. (in: thermotogales)]